VRSQLNQILTLCHEQGVELNLDGDELALYFDEYPSDELVRLIRENKPELIAYLTEKNGESVDGIPVVRVSRERENYPLSASQLSLWVLNQLSGGSSSYSLPKVFRYQGKLKPALVKRAMKEIVGRHEILRTCYCQGKQGPVQVIRDDIQFDILWTELSDVGQVDTFIHEESLKEFDLSQDCPLKVTIARLGSRSGVIVLNMHHIASDGHSMDNLVQEFVQHYHSLSKGLEMCVPELEFQYIDYADWQQRLLASPAVHTSIAYWQEQLAGLEPVHSLTLDRERQRRAGATGKVITSHVTKSLAEQLLRLAQHQDATLFMVLQTALSVIIERFGRCKDIAIGTPVAGRNNPHWAKLIGCFVNTLVLRSQVDASRSFTALLRDNRRMILDAFSHADVPFDTLVDALNPERVAGINPLFQIMLGLQKREQKELSLDELTLTAIKGEETASRFDLEVAVIESSDGLEIRWIYDSSIFNESTVTNFSRCFDALLAAVIYEPERSINQHQLLDTEAVAQLCDDWNETKVPFDEYVAIHSLIEQQVRRSPNAIAVTFGLQSLTYSQLDQRAITLALHLRHLGVEQGDIIGIRIERSFELIIAILAVLKAGCAYLPIDPELPPSRERYMMSDAGLKLLLVGNSAAEAEFPEAVTSVHFDAELSKLEGDQIDGVLPDVNSDALAYVIYTSGSTGKPKGVMVPHRAVVNRIQWMQRQYKLNKKDVVLQKTPVSFDVSVWEYLWPLFSGARMVLAKAGGHKDPKYLSELIVAEKVSTLHFVPSMLDAFLDSTQLVHCPTLKKVFCSGEELTANQQHKFFNQNSQAELYNLYGPTEAAIDVTHWTCRRDVAKPLIGQPIDNIRLYILDDHANELPLGAKGELCIAGAGLARGYLNQSELSTERFITRTVYGRQERLYRTGDLARWNTEGQIDFLGRLDNQLKLRGFRIEPGEIEVLLSARPDIENAIVRLAQVNGQPELIAYCIAAEGPVDLNDVESELNTELPAYMVPRYFKLIDQLPLTANGKLDVKALPTPNARTSMQNQIAPRDKTEQGIADIWHTLFAEAEFGVRDDFFKVGGNSLLATRLVNGLRQQFSVAVEVVDIFEHVTIEKQAVLLSSRSSVLTKQIERQSRNELLPLSFAQQRLWFIEQLESESSQYNMSLQISLTGVLEPERFRRSVQGIVDGHEILRTTYHSVDGVPRQKIHAHRTIRCEWLDLSTVAESERQARLDRAIIKENLTSFDLQKDVMLRFTLVKMAEDSHVVLMNIHHIASDGWSIPLLVSELNQRYNQRNFAVEVTPNHIQYADFAVWQRQLFSANQLDEQLDYWKCQLADLPPLHSLPLDYRRPAVQNFQGALLEREIPLQLSDKLDKLAQSYNVTPFMLLQGAFSLLLGRFSGSKDVVVGSPISGRSHTGLNDMLGCFVNSLVLRTRLEERQSFVDYLKQVKATMLDAFSNQDVPFEMLVSQLVTERELSYSPLFQIMFVLQNSEVEAIALNDLVVEVLPEVQCSTRFDLEVSMIRTGRGYIVDWKYATGLFEQTTITSLADCFEVLLSSICNNPEQNIFELPFVPEADLLRYQASDIDKMTFDKQTIVDCFDRVVEQQPALPALSGFGEELDYSELDRRANRLANWLVNQGSVTNGFVGICMERSINMVISVLATLKAGYAYVPVAPEYPVERRRYILEDSAITLVLCTEKTLKVIAAERVNQVDVAEIIEERTLPETRPIHTIKASAPAFLLYTSGSTGQPKGVVQTHRTMVHLALGQMEFGHGLCDRLRTLQFSPLVFDASIHEMTTAWATASPLVLMSDDEKIELGELPNLLSERGIERAFMPPAVLHHIVCLCDSRGETLPLLRELVIAGEELYMTEALASFLQRHPKLVLMNHYGPTETHVVTVKHMTAAEIGKGSNIGLGLINHALYVVSPQEQLQPVGAVGELWAAGPGVALGYLNKPEQTAECFVANPFFSDMPLYKTGDLVRLLPNGEFQYIGRHDSQIQIRGFRVEPSEIESVVNRLPEIGICRIRISGEGEHKHLIAYIVLNEGCREPDIKAYLKQHLPGYMHPDSVVSLDDIPLTTNGKLDVDALPPIVFDKHTREPINTETEFALAELWQPLLGSSAAIGRNSSFFELGGHSMLAARLVLAVAERFDINLTIRELFEHAQLDTLAALIDEKQLALQLTSEPTPDSHDDEREMLI